MKSVVHLLGPSQGGIRRHVHYLASNPPPGWRTAQVIGPAILADYFHDLAFTAADGARLALAGRDADIIHAHGLTAGVAALLPRRPPVVLSLHLLIGAGGRTSTSPLLRLAARAIIHRADAVVAASSRVAAGVRGSRVIAPAVAPLQAAQRSRSEVRRELGASDDEVVVLTVSRLHRDKRLHLFVEAVTSAGATGWIAGDGPLREELQNLVRSTSVHLLGHRSDVEDLYAAADMFVLTSAAEGYGIAVAEAIASGLPVVAVDTGAIAELSGGGAILCAPDSAQALSDATRKLVEDASLRLELASLARQATAADPEALVKAVGGVYDELTS